MVLKLGSQDTGIKEKERRLVSDIIDYGVRLENINRFGCEEEPQYHS